MFSGIVEATGKLLNQEPLGDCVRIFLERPPTFDDLKTGDSIAVDGVCLTVEEFTDKVIRFALGPETLRICEPQWPSGYLFNLERSLRLGDRLHGHLVTGHVDGRAKLEKVVETGLSKTLEFSVDHPFAKLLWLKGSVTLNGVSLTVNTVAKAETPGESSSRRLFSVGLIPETLERTNLSRLAVGDFVNIEFDWMAKGLFHLETNR